jgi:hypothetical protein
MGATLLELGFASPALSTGSLVVFTASSTALISSIPRPGFCIGALVFLGVDTRCPPAFLVAGFEVDLGVELASDRVGLDLEILLAIEIKKGECWFKAIISG